MRSARTGDKRVDSVLVATPEAQKQSGCLKDLDIDLKKIQR